LITSENILRQTAGGDSLITTLHPTGLIIFFFVGKIVADLL